MARGELRCKGSLAGVVCSFELRTIPNKSDWASKKRSCFSPARADQSTRSAVCDGVIKAAGLLGDFAQRLLGLLDLYLRPWEWLASAEDDQGEDSRGQSRDRDIRTACVCPEKYVKDYGLLRHVAKPWRRPQGRARGACDLLIRPMGSNVTFGGAGAACG